MCLRKNGEAGETEAGDLAGPEVRRQRLEDFDFKENAGHGER